MVRHKIFAASAKFPGGGASRVATFPTSGFRRRPRRSAVGSRVADFYANRNKHIVETLRTRLGGIRMKLGMFHLVLSLAAVLPLAVVQVKAA
ncbi:MAG: hypothetical protein IJX36_08110, partial [Thermoguttaceae bacterium]|nr:hypothetical protein [Thermoguttaceae bacterium]